MASSGIAYLLWLIGGCFGLHHVYLRRDYQAFLWGTSFGVCGLGLLRDVWRIPDYVSELNNDVFFQENQNLKLRYEAVPSLLEGYGLHRVLAQFFFGALYYFVLYQASSALCEDPEHGLLALGFHVPPAVPQAFGTLGMIAGIWMAGNTSNLVSSKFQWLISGCILGFVLKGLFGQLCLGVLFFYWERHWVRTPKKPSSFTYRILGLSFAGAIYLFCWIVIIFFLEFTAGVGESRTARKVRMRDAVIHICKSRFWERAWSEFRETYSEKGWDGVMGWMDVTGEAHARKVLGVSKDATLKEVRAAFRKLAREWHPDRNPDPRAKQKMEELNEAHQLLQKILQ